MKNGFPADVDKGNNSYPVVAVKNKSIFLRD